MPIAQSMLPEFDHEMATTRSLLERVPEEKADWKPHTKSMSLGRLALHLTELPTWGTMVITETELNLNPPGGMNYPRPTFESTAGLLEKFDENVTTARTALAAISDDELMVMWTLKHGEETLFSMPRVAVLRSMVVNHIIHHRGQLSVYLRLNDVPLPSIYGPTADTESQP